MAAEIMGCYDKVTVVGAAAVSARRGVESFIAEIVYNRQFKVKLRYGKVSAAVHIINSDSGHFRWGRLFVFCENIVLGTDIGCGRSCVSDNVFKLRQARLRALSRCPAFGYIENAKTQSCRYKDRA